MLLFKNNIPLLLLWRKGTASDCKRDCCWFDSHSGERIISNCSLRYLSTKCVPLSFVTLHRERGIKAPQKTFLYFIFRDCFVFQKKMFLKLN